MKKKLLYSSLIILPALLFILEIIFNHSKGEYYLYDNYDGPYAYLLASLNLAQFTKPGYTQHPGIIPQIISATIIKISHFLQGNDPDIVADTFSRPEFYFNRINAVYAFIAAIALFFLGKVTFEKTGSILGGIFLQFTPFINVIVFYSLATHTGLGVNIILTILLLIIVVSYLNEPELTAKKNRGYIIKFGITCGLFLANVISNLPIFIIPFLILKKFRNKAYFVLTSLVTFLILFVAITPDSTMIWKFVFKNITHSGKYGAGPAEFIDVNRIIPSIQLIYNAFFIFTIIYFMMVVTLLLQFIPKFKKQIRADKYFLVLVGIFIIMTMYILLVIKQVEGYYLLPGLLFSVMALYSINSIISGLFPKPFKFSKYIYVCLFFIVFTYPQIRSFKNSVLFFTSRKIESHKILKFINENYPNKLIVSSDFTASMPTAFYNGLNNSGDQTKRYVSILENKFPNYIYFQRWRKDFIYLPFSEAQKNKLMTADTLIFHGFNEANLNDFKQKFTELTKKQNTTYQEVFANKNGEKLYLVIPK